MKFIDKKEKGLLSDQEIGQHMNFDKFISGYAPSGGWFSAGAKLYTLIAAVSAVLIITAFLVFNNNGKSKTTDTSFVSPPIKEMDISSDSFILNTDKDSTLLFSTGTFISVPSGAFADAQGNVITGKVEVHYREFHDPIDILLSGIPMNYDSAGITYQFESAGMFEITATQDGKPLSLLPDKTLVVNMISKNPNENDFNTYNLDTTERKWKYISENTKANNSCVKAFEDRVALAGQPADDEFSKPVAPQKATAGADNFSIDFNADEFPELAAFSGLKFEPVKGEKKYKSSLAEKTWENVVVERHSDGEHYVVTFSSGKETHRFTVNPVVDEKDHAKAMTEFTSRMKAYEAVKKNRSSANDSLYRLNAKFQNLAFKADKMNERFNSFVSNSYSETSHDLLVYRTFALRRLGTWNCDRPIEFFAALNNMKAKEYAAQFVNEKGKSLNLLNVFLTRKLLNSVYEIEQARFGQFPFNKSVDAVIGITHDKKLVYLKGEELKNMNVEGSVLNFTMHSVPAGIVSPEQLKSLLKI